MKIPWYLRQKSAVALVAGLGGLFTMVDLARAQFWANAQPGSWQAVASSADGTRLLAAATAFPPSCYGDAQLAPLYTSTNSGATWSNTGLSNFWAGVASSAFGSNLVAVSSIGVFSCALIESPRSLFGDGGIYVSHDSGATWRQTGPFNTWSCAASSADGTKVVAAATSYQSGGPGLLLSGDGGIYTSANSGETWTFTSAPRHDWASIASSANGSRLVAAGNQQIYVSTNYGVTWAVTTAPSNSWTSVASSADGTELIAAASDTSNISSGSGYVYISRDSGESWAPTGAPNLGWGAVASSADGTRLLAASASPDNQWIYSSIDSGITWRPTAAPNLAGTALASSADGYRVIAGGGAGLCTLPYLGPWRPAAAPIGGCRAVAVSSNAAKCVAAGAQIYTSTDSGASWKATSAPTTDWWAVASSADGTTLIAADQVYHNDYPSFAGGAIYRSLDSGGTWIRTSAPMNGWMSLASSADGTKMVAAAASIYSAFDNQIYTSTNAGATWALTRAPTNVYWLSVACSADGDKLVAAGGGGIYMSPDSGGTWNQASVPNVWWMSVASSADGTKLVAGAEGDVVYTSTNSGATWAADPVPTNDWSSVASSADGTTLLAVGGWAYFSTNSGAVWAPLENPAGASWYAVACSGDGKSIVALDQFGLGAIGTLNLPPPGPPAPPAPRLTLGVSGADLLLSWLVPSTGFVLQQNSDLTSPDWLDVTIQPNFFYNDLHNQLIVTPSQGSIFFRMKPRGAN